MVATSFCLRTRTIQCEVVDCQASCSRERVCERKRIRLWPRCPYIEIHTLSFDEQAARYLNSSTAMTPGDFTHMGRPMTMVLQTAHLRGGSSPSRPEDKPLMRKHCDQGPLHTPFHEVLLVMMVTTNDTDISTLIPGASNKHTNVCHDFPSGSDRSKSTVLLP